MSCTNCSYYFFDEVEMKNVCHWIPTKSMSAPREIEEDCYSDELEEGSEDYFAE